MISTAALTKEVNLWLWEAVLPVFAAAELFLVVRTIPILT